ncbi:hypothetical protein I4U23_000617 [Adineta vaga]|nr:hypothetical protein I4U23_000617 [Adineta vaga]
MNTIENQNSGLPLFQPGISLANVIGEQMSINHSNETLQGISSIPSQTESNHDSERQSMNESENLKYKTELCRNFSIYGLCSYSSRCQFAHGLEELRSRNRHPKYKTELCRNFLSGHCKYGVRCQFLHQSEEMKETRPINESIAAFGTYLLTNLLAQSALLTNFYSKSYSSYRRMSMPYNCGIEMQQQLHLSHGISFPQNQNNNDYSHYQTTDLSYEKNRS